LIVGVLIASIFLPFVITVYAITGASVAILAVVSSSCLFRFYAQHSKPCPGLRLAHPPLLVFNTYKMLGAAMIPGNPQANMYFTLYGYNTLDQARGLIRDLKMVVIGRCHWLSSSLT
jgi:hypothetical protein